MYLFNLLTYIIFYEYNPKMDAYVTWLQILTVLLTNINKIIFLDFFNSPSTCTSKAFNLKVTL